MGVFSGGDKYYRRAEGFDARAYGLEQEIGYMQSNRELLSQIRQARLAAANDAYMTDQVTGEYIEQSSAASAVNNIYSTFGGAYGYSMDLNQRNEELETTELYSQMLKKKGAKADKRAATATQITMAVLAVAGGFVGAAALGGVAGLSTTSAAGIGVMGGAAVGKGVVSAMKPGRVARKASTKAAVNYGIIGATMAVGGMTGGAEASTAKGTTGAAQTTGGSIQSAGGISKSTVTFTENGVTGVANVGKTVQPPASVAKTGWLSSAKTYAEYASYGQQISKALTPDYSDVDARYKNALYNRRYARIRGGY